MSDPEVPDELGLIWCLYGAEEVIDTALARLAAALNLKVLTHCQLWARPDGDVTLRRAKHPQAHDSATLQLLM